MVTEKLNYFDIHSCFLYFDGYFSVPESVLEIHRSSGLTLQGSQITIGEPITALQG